MTQHQQDLIKSSFRKILPIAHEATDLFYSRLFEIAPYLQALFVGDIKMQGEKMMQALTLTVDNLDRIEEIVGELQIMGRDNKSFGVANAHYDIVTSALLWTLERGLGSEFTDEVRNAWVALYGVIVESIKKRAKESSIAA